MAKGTSDRDYVRCVTESDFGLLALLYTAVAPPTQPSQTPEIQATPV